MFVPVCVYVFVPVHLCVSSAHEHMCLTVLLREIVISVYELVSLNAGRNW